MRINAVRTTHSQLDSVKISNNIVCAYTLNIYLHCCQTFYGFKFPNICFRRSNDRYEVVKVSGVTS